MAQIDFICQFYLPKQHKLATLLAKIKIFVLTLYIQNAILTTWIPFTCLTTKDLFGLKTKPSQITESMAYLLMKRAKYFLIPSVK